MFYADCVVAQRDVGDHVGALQALECCDKVDEALHYPPPSRLSSLSSLRKNNHLYHLKDEELGDWQR